MRRRRRTARRRRFRTARARRLLGRARRLSGRARRLSGRARRLSGGLLPLPGGRGPLPGGLRTARALRRAVLAAALLAVAFLPASGLAGSGPQRPGACRDCRAQPATTERWAVPLSGTWTAGSGTAGTVPAAGQAYAAVGGGIAVLGSGLTLTAFAVSDGRQLWQVTLTAPAGSAITSVRAWPGAVTAGLLGASGGSRTEVVISAGTGRPLRRYPAAMFGGAVAASAATTVIVGPNAVTSYDNGNGRVRWRRAIGPHRAWRADGQTLYVAESPGGYLGTSPVTELKVINMRSGAERTLGSPLGHPFSGTLALAADGVVLFASAAGVTAYSGSTGGAAWSMAGAVPEGTDPMAHLIYVTSASGTLTSVDPQTGAVRAAVTGSTAGGGTAAMYVVRNGVALGLDTGAQGQAWGYSVAAGRVSWTSPVLPWPHYFSGLSGLGGSASVTGSVVVVTACPHLAASARVCADPELVAFTL